jgi:hypothetical protein
MKDTYAKVRLTQAEKELLLEKAAAVNMTLSDYIKYCCLINPPKIHGFERENEYVSKV